MKQTNPYTVPSFTSGLSITTKGNSTRSYSYAVNFFKKGTYTSISKFFLILVLCITGKIVFSQNCPTSGTTNLSSTSNNTYYPGLSATLNSGATSISLGAAGTGTYFGSTPIAAGDILLLIQMQGAQINTSNSVSYGANSSGGFGFTSGSLFAGNMEFVIASNAVPLSGGTLNLTSGIVNSYANAAYGTYGQYTYQIIRVPSYYNIKLTGAINTPLWNGSTGGVVVISAINQLDFNGQTITAAGAGFRGGGGRSLSGASGYSKNDFYSPASAAANGSKGEGIAGTPRYVNNNGVLLDNISEGYPNGSYARGAPGNAGGGGTDNNPSANDQNSGGGGGGNGGTGGMGGRGWYIMGLVGGRGGSDFILHTSPYTVYYSPSRLIMGGGGGAGTNNNSTGTPGSGFASSGAAGGGLVIVNALSIIGTGTIDASGADANSTVANDASGGGGAGGSILLYANSGLSGITAIAAGGDGGTNRPLDAGPTTTQHGPGGGGGGGIIFSNGTLNATSVAGGLAGKSRGVINYTPADSSFGAVAGSAGKLTQTFPASQLPPKMRICQGILLPVNLLGFGAALTSSNNVQVSWTVSSQVSLDHYQIERSVDGASFNSIGELTAGQQTDYAYTDYLNSVNASIVYYRLKMVDQDGNSVYSKIIPVRLEQTTDAKIGVYPNPAVDFTVLKLYSDNQTVARIKLIDDAGRQIINRSVTVNTGNNSLMIDQLGSLPKGIYIVQVVLNNTLHNEKLIKK